MHLDYFYIRSYYIFGTKLCIKMFLELSYVLSFRWPLFNELTTLVNGPVVTMQLISLCVDSGKSIIWTSKSNYSPSYK